MNKQWKISLAVLALAVGCFAQSIYAAEKAPAKPASATAAAMVNVNTATVDQLSSIKGLGSKKAQAIIDYRKENGAFKTVDDLSNVPGISDKLLASIKGHVTVA